MKSAASNGIRILRMIPEFVLLTAAYIVGIGITSLATRALGIRFMTKTTGVSSWSAPSGSHDSAAMF